MVNRIIIYSIFKTFYEVLFSKILCEVIFIYLFLAWIASIFQSDIKPTDQEKEKQNLAIKILAYVGIYFDIFCLQLTIIYFL